MHSSLYVALFAVFLGFGGDLALAQEPTSQDLARPEVDKPVTASPLDVVTPDVEPIILLEEFREAVPSFDVQVDPALEGPLESVDDFERRVAAEQADLPADGRGSPLGEPALADGDVLEATGDAPIPDAALAEPLPPIDPFELDPVEFAEAEAEEKSVEVAYRLEIEGLREADRQTDAELRERFNELSALRDGDGEAVNIAMLAARLTQDSELMGRLLASEGWFNPKITTRIEPSGEEAGDPMVAIINVAPRQRYKFAAVNVEAPPVVPPGLIRETLGLQIGKPIIAEEVLSAEAQVMVVLPATGYPFAEIGERDILLNRATGLGVYTLPVEPGPRSLFAGIRTTGDLAFGVDHIRTLARFKAGQLYDARLVDDLRKALVATGLFATVSIEPVRTGEEAVGGTEFAALLVKQEAGPPRTIAGSAGYGTGEGFRVEATWMHRNLFPPEGALIAKAVAGTAEQGASVTFRRSNAGKRDRTFELVAEAAHSDFDAFDAYTGRLAGQIRYESTPIWQKTFTYAYGMELLATAETDYNFELGRNTRRTFYVAGLNGQVGLDYTDDLLNPTKGFRATALLQPEGSLEGGFNPYLRTRLDASAYALVTEDLVAAGRISLGTIQGADLRDIAPSRRLYAGGGGSVRGFGYRQLGPEDPNGDPIGGRSLNEAALELRYRFGAYGIVGFVDVGQSYADTFPQFSNLRFGLGVGGRFYTNLGPLRVDVATPINRRPGESRINIYVSIGQAF